METQTNGFLWTLLTRKKTKKHKNNLIKNKIERANTELNRESDSTKPQSQTRMFSRRKKTFLSFTLSLFYLFVAPVMQVLPVYAAEPAAALSVWDFMVTELVGANCIITDSAVLSAYGSALGGLNAATATAAQIDAAIATAAANCGVDLAPVFANTAATAAQVGVEAAAATAGENLATTCAGFYAAGEGSAVIPAIGQVLMDAASAAGIVAGIAYIGKMVAETFGDIIKFGQDVNALSALASMPTAPPTNFASGNSMGTLKYTVGGRPFRAYLGSPVCYVLNSSKYLTIYITNTTNTTIMGQIYDFNTQQWSSASTRTGPFSYTGVYSMSNFTNDFQMGNIHGFSSKSAMESYLNKFRSGEYQPVFPSTPSIASSTGYQKYNPGFNPSNTEVQTPGFPDIAPLPDYANGYGLEPITPPSYQALVDAILEVPGNPSYREQQLSNDNSIAEIVQPLISPHIVPLPEVNPNPNPDPQPTGSPDPQPTGSPDPNPNPNPKPDTQPFPDPETVPQPTPVVNPTPDSDVVPAPVPYPDPETPTEQDKTDTDTKITPIDLRDKFPFCIPFDILKIMKLFQGGREAPCFTWTIPFGQAGSGEVTVDLSAWDSAATLLRTLELILFIMLLAVGTRNLIGGSS